jgi:hypothetical protein
LSKYILWFERQKEKDRVRERQLQYTIIILGAIIPVINVIGIEQLQLTFSPPFSVLALRY